MGLALLYLRRVYVTVYVTVYVYLGQIYHSQVGKGCLLGLSGKAELRVY